MNVIASLVLVSLPQASAATPAESWDALAAEYDLAVERWFHAQVRSEPAGESPASPAADYWPRFERLAQEGEGQATLWLLANLQPGKGAEVLALVKRSADAEWVASALHDLGAYAGEFDEVELIAHLEERMGTSTRDDLRACAALALAEVLAGKDAEQAAYHRLWAAMLLHKQVDLAPGETLARADLDELGASVVERVEKESRSHFALAYRQGADDVYYPRAGAPTDPKERWRPVIEELATRGSTGARLWALANAPWQLDERGKARLRGFLEALAGEPLPEKELRTFGYEIGGLVYRLGLPAVEPSIRTLIDASPDTARPGLLFGLGDAVCEAAREDAALRERGLVLLREVRGRWPESEAAKRAEGRIFRYTNLVVGKPCPDFETVDADGNAFKLSDYEGKVTVVDFWGFW